MAILCVKIFYEFFIDIFEWMTADHPFLSKRLMNKTLGDRGP